MTPAEFEHSYEALAVKIDQVGEENCQIYLAKLALLMAHQIGDVSIVAKCINEAAESLGKQDDGSD